MSLRRADNADVEHMIAHALLPILRAARETEGSLVETARAAAREIRVELAERNYHVFELGRAAEEDTHDGPA